MKFLQLILCKVFGLTLELKSRAVSKRVLSETLRHLPAVKHKDALQENLPGGPSKR
jgi:hypothetical protein